MTVEAAEQDILQEIRTEVQDGKGKNVVILVMKKFDEVKGKMLRSLEWSKLDELWRFHDCIYVPLITDLCHQIMEQHHDSHIAGQWKMLELLMRSYWWPNMLCYVGQ
jgi:Integrase zinc binding domain